MKNMKNRSQESGVRRPKKISLFIFLSLFAFHCSLLTGLAFAAAEGGEHGGFTMMDWVWKVVNFTILVVLLVKFVGKPLKNFLQQRKELIEKSIRESQEAKELARKALTEVEERLKLKDKEVEEIVSVAKSSGDAEKNRLIEESARMQASIVEKAKANIEHEVAMAKEAIRTEAVEAAMQLAEEKIKKKMTKDQQEKLLQESIKLLEGRN